MKPYEVLISSLLITCLTWDLCTSLECYVCESQDGNTDKCLKTIKTCEQEQDTCLTEIRWGSTPYWNEGAEKQYYISKSCSVRADCERTRSNFMQYCIHLWYEDWKCAECCQGDRCNYYVILSGSSNSANLFLMFGLVMLVAAQQLFIGR